MKTKASLAIPILLAVSLLLGASNALAGPFGEIVVFVDRFSDNGNDLLFDDLPVPDPELYGEGRFSNGQVWVEYLTDICPNPDGSTFFLFHRPRRWNPRDRIWMGYERQRGKLADLNWLLRDGAHGTAADRFALVIGETRVLANVKYVITLDTDTQLSRDSAWQFVGAMAHPLNLARYDKSRQRVVAGYDILQPRVAVSLSGMNQSRYPHKLHRSARRGAEPSQ